MDAAPPLLGGAPPGHEAGLADLEPDAFAAVCTHLPAASVAALAAASGALRHAVASNDRLWSELYGRQFPAPWRRLTQRAAVRDRGGRQGVAPGGWRSVYLATHEACQQLRSIAPAERQWATDSAAVHLAAIHGSGPQRLTVTAQGSGVELRPAPELSTTKSWQLYGHSARVSAVAVLAPGAGSCAASAVRRLGVATASLDQTLRLWSLNADPESYEFGAQPLSLLTPLRTLRGHGEGVTSLQPLASSTGVTIAATGSKDRTVRLWGLAPLLPSPVHKPQIATLRGHGAPITCLALAGGGSTSGGGSSEAGGGGGWLLSGSLDARVKQWDPWTAACIGTAKLAAPVTAMQAAAAAPALQPHSLLVAGGTGVQLLDLRCMRPVAGLGLPERAEAVHCLSQWGWDLAVGSSDSARVFDLRGGTAGSSSSSGTGGSVSRGWPERLRLTGHARPVTSVHVDRHKVVTATDRYSPAPLRAWCADTGEPLADLGSALPPPPPPPQQRLGLPSGAVEAAVAAAVDGGSEQADELAAAAAAAAEEEEAAASSRPRHAYHQEWEGVTALAVRGALLVSGSSEGTVVERDFSRGGLPEAEGEWGGGGGLGLLGGPGGKFWQSGGLGPDPS